MAKDKYILDTSVMRPLLLGTSEYKKYINDVLDGDKYVSNFPKMELRRSFVINVINFYYALKMPSIKTVNEAILLMTNSFKGQELKAVLQLIPQITKNNDIDINDPAQLHDAQIALRRIINRLDILISGKFKDPGKDSVHCERSYIKIVPDEDGGDDYLEKFHDKFSNVKDCRKKCRIEYFILKRNITHINNFFKKDKSLKKNAENHGFKLIVEKLQKAVDKGGNVLTCRFCGGIGDAVITLDSPSEMKLAHTDKSFNHLCPESKQPNVHINSEVTFHKMQK